MKKIIAILLLLLIFTGCSNKDNMYSHLSNGEEVLFKGPDAVYTKEDYYKSLKVSSKSAIESDIFNKIATNLNIDMNKINEELNTTLETYKTLGYDSAIISYYGSINGFKASYINSAIMNELTKLYITDNFDSLLETDKPVKMQFAYFDTKEAAEKVIEELNNDNETTFETAAANNGYTQTTPVQIYLDSDTILPLEIKSYLNETDTTGLSTIITSTSASKDADGNSIEVARYYLLNIADRDVNNFKDEYIEQKASKIESTKVKEHYLSTHEISFFDQDVYELMSSTYEVLK